jgi:hypothetical protein
MILQDSSHASSIKMAPWTTIANASDSVRPQLEGLVPLSLTRAFNLSWQAFRAKILMQVAAGKGKARSNLHNAYALSAMDNGRKEARIYDEQLA